MPPLLAALLCYAFIAWLLLRDRKYWQGFEGILWVPLAWLLILGSRPLSFWLGLSSAEGGELEGNSFDRNLLLGLALASIVIIARRGIQWGTLLKNNGPLFLFYLFLLASCLWAEYPLVVFKRWFKDISAVLVGLVMLSALDPKKAIQSVYAKCAIILFPLSVVLIRYFSGLGRVYMGSGSQLTGVTEQKNALGELVVVLGLVLFWQAMRSNPNFERKLKIAFAPMNLFLLGVGVWLLLVSDSKTALLCLLCGLMVLVYDRIPFIGTQPKVFVGFVLLVLPLAYLLDSALGLSHMLLGALGRDASFTGRTGIWQAVAEHPVDPLLGCGYLMYWDVTGKIMVSGYLTELKTAHNGYLELYLDGGWIGVSLFALVLVTMGTGIVREFLSGSIYGRVRLAFFLSILLHNFSESTFARRGMLWFAFLLFCADYRRVFPWQVQDEDETRESVEQAAEPDTESNAPGMRFQNHT